MSDPEQDGTPERLGDFLLPSSPAGERSPRPPGEREAVLLPGGFLLGSPAAAPPPEDGPDEGSAAADDGDDEDLAPPDGAALLRKARFMLEIGRPEDALRLLQELVDWYPEDPDAWCEVARAFYALEDAGRAARAADLAIEADRFSAAGYAWKCRALLRQQDWKRALETSRTGSEMTYGDPETERWTVRALLAGGKRVEAGRHLAEAGLPEDAGSACLHGELARLGEDVPAADAAFRHAVLLDPGCGEAWSGLSAVLLKQSRPEEAVSCLHRAVQLEPGPPDLGSRTVEVVDAFLGRKTHGLARYGMGLMLVSIFCTPGLSTLVSFPLGLVWYLAARPSDRRLRERALSALPREVRGLYRTRKAEQVRETWLGLGCLLGLLLAPLAGVALFFQLGWEGALRLLLLCILVLPFVWSAAARARPEKTPEVPFRFPGDPYVPGEPAGEDPGEEPGVPPDWEPDPVSAGWEFLVDGRAAAAREKARGVLAGDPESVDALALFSAASLLLEEFGPGLAAAKSARALDPEDVRAHALVWTHLAAAGRLEEAVASAEEAREAADDAGDLLVSMVRLQFHSGPVRAARALSELVQRVYPGSAEPLEVEGHWAFETGRWAEAEAAYRRALALEPESASLHASLAWTLERRWRFREAREESRRALALDPEERNARTVLERQVFLGVVGFAALLSGALSLAAAFPTFLGSAANPWMVAATLLGPLLAGGAVYLVLKPVLRRVAPGLLLELGPWGSMDPHLMALIGAGAALTLSLTAHTLQAWLEILLHPELLPARWPGAATVTACAAALWWGVVRLVLQVRADE